MSRSHEPFLARWSRLKSAAEETAAVPAPVPRAAPAVPLPDPDTLGFDSDFSVFLGDRVDAAIKRQAMSKLFQCPEFNVMDGLDVYIDDYGRPDPVSEELLKNLAHARDLIFDAPEAESEPAAAADPQPKAEDSREH